MPRSVVACRDLRRGKATGTAQEIPRGVRTSLTWGGDYAGSMVEDYVCPEGDTDTMNVVSTLTIGGRSITTTQVFVRAGGSKEALLRESEKRNGNAGDVFKRLGVMPKLPFNPF
jgi:hypothetical protein